MIDTSQYHTDWVTDGENYWARCSPPPTCDLTVIYKSAYCSGLPCNELSGYWPEDYYQGELPNDEWPDYDYDEGRYY